MVRPHELYFGDFVLTLTVQCFRCKGSGVVDDADCTECDGVGLILSRNGQTVLRLVRDFRGVPKTRRGRPPLGVVFKPGPPPESSEAGTWYVLDLGDEGYALACKFDKYDFPWKFVSTDGASIHPSSASKIADVAVNGHARLGQISDDTTTQEGAST